MDEAVDLCNHLTLSQLRRLQAFKALLKMCQLYVAPCAEICHGFLNTIAAIQEGNIYKPVYVTMYHKVEYILPHVSTYRRAAPVTLYVISWRTFTAYLWLSLRWMCVQLTHKENWIKQKTNKNPRTHKKGMLPSACTQWQCFCRVNRHLSSHERQFAHRDKTPSKAEAKGNASKPKVNLRPADAWSSDCSHS